MDNQMSSNNINEEQKKSIENEKQKLISNNIAITSESSNSKNFVNLTKEVPIPISSDSTTGNEKDENIIRVSSTLSIGFPDFSSEQAPIEKNEHNILMSLPDKSESHKILFDVYCLSIICTEHKRIALQSMPNKYYFLPYVQFEPDMSFSKLFKDFLRLIIVNPHGKASIPEIADIWRVQQPKTNEYVTRYIFKTLLYPVEGVKNGKNSQNCCINNNKIRWLNIEELNNSLKTINSDVKLWGNEPLRILESLDSTTNLIREFCIIDMVHFLKSPDVALLFQIVEHDERDTLKLFNEFLVQCYPSEVMTFTSFCLYCAKLSFSNHFTIEKLYMLFNSFDINRMNVLSFKEILLGLLIMDDNVTTLSQSNSNSSLLIDMRYQYLFRYYDTNFDDFLEKNELFLILNNYIDEIGPFDERHSFQSVQKKTMFIDNLIENFGSKNLKTGRFGLSFSQARVALNDSINEFNKSNNKSGKLPELLTILYRLPFDVISYAGTKFIFKRIMEKSIYSEFCLQLDYHQFCSACHNSKYSLSHHLIRMSKVGDITDIVRLEPLASNGNMSFVVDIPESDIFIMANDILNRIQRFAMVLFNHQIFDEDYPEHANQGEMVGNWFFPNQADKLDSIRLILQNVLEIFAKEKRVLELKSPFYVFGDIHGNLKDLAIFSQQFWRCSPFINKGNYLFLGDYVDRGQWGIEVIIFLFGLKILAPNNFFLLRGNHEIREVQEQFSFFAECRNRLTVELWEMINDCFDRMPIAAVIDKSLFCSHGGIPTSVTTIGQLGNIHCPIENPFQSPETWEILWNDPINIEEWNLLPDFERSFIRGSHGFARNFKRGTAYMYGEEAVANFCKRNSIEFILRAHEVFPQGFFFFIRGKVVSIFSSSKYSNLNNTAAVLIVKQSRIRVVRVESSE